MMGDFYSSPQQPQQTPQQFGQGIAQAPWANQGINFNPSVGLATADPSVRPNRTGNQPYFSSWPDPMQEFFGGKNNLAGPYGVKNTSMGVALPGEVDPFGATGGAKSGSLNQSTPDFLQPGFNPANPQDLMNQIQGLSYDQLRELDYSGKYQQQFGSAAQQYADNFANPNYARLGGTQAIHTGRFDGNPYRAQGTAGPKESMVSNERAQNWLQAAYGMLMDRLNKNYLL
jgi:hypothetical protein